MTNPIFILGSGAPDKNAAELMAAPIDSLYVDATNLPFHSEGTAGIERNILVCKIINGQFNISSDDMMSLKNGDIIIASSSSGYISSGSGIQYGANAKDGDVFLNNCLFSETNTTIAFAKIGSIKADNTSAIPAGSIIAYDRSLNGGNIPDGFVLCLGQSITLSNGSKIILKDLRGNFIRGFDAGSGNDDKGRVLGSFQGDRIREIGGWASYIMLQNYAFNQTGVLQLDITGNWGINTGIIEDNNAFKAGGLNFDISRGTPTGSDNAPKNVALEYIVKLPDTAFSSLNTNTNMEFVSFLEKPERKEVIVYCYSPSDHAYTGTYRYDKYPFESLPPNTTNIQPDIASLKKGFTFIFDAAKQIWNQIQDYRGKIVYSKQDGSPFEIKQLGALPENYTEIKPPNITQSGEAISWTDLGWQVSPPSDLNKAKQNLGRYYTEWTKKMSLGNPPPVSIQEQAYELKKWIDQAEKTEKQKNLSSDSFKTISQSPIESPSSFAPPLISSTNLNW